VTNNTDTAASIHQRLKKMTADNWMNDATHLCRAVLAQCAKISSLLLEPINGPWTTY